MEVVEHRTKGRAWAVVAAIAVMAVAVGGCGRRGGQGVDGEEAWLRAERGDVRPWVAVAGVAAPRRVERIASKLQGAGVLVELAAEGSRVGAGDVVARFETSQLEQDLARQEGEVERARQELASLEGAELPLEVLELEAKVGESESELAGEEAFLEVAGGLAGRGLMGEGEVERQQERVEGVRARLGRDRRRLELTEGALHPARLAKARAALAAAEAARDFTKGQLALCEVRASEGGVVSLVALPMGGELRPAEVGDTVYRNQVFMALPDVGEMVVDAWLEERDWGRVEVGARAVATAAGASGGALAEGVVESVGRVGRGGRYPVRIGLEGAVDWPAGMSVTAKVWGEAAEGVVRVRRDRVRWGAEGAWVWVPGEAAGEEREQRPGEDPRTPRQDNERAVRRGIVVGAVDEAWAEVREGLGEGAAYR